MKSRLLLPIASLSLSLPLIACSGGTESAPESHQQLETSVAANGLLRTDNCNRSAGYELSTHNSPELQPGLHVVGIYTADFSPAPWEDDDCAAALDACSETGCEDIPDACDVGHKLSEATVFVDIPGANSLVLTAYEPTHWTVEVAPGSTLEKVFLSGYYDQTALVPEGTEIVQHGSSDVVYEWLSAEDLSLGCEEGQQEGGDEYCEYLGEEWERGRLETAATRDRLLSWAEPLAGMPVSSFTGCYNMSDLSLSAEVKE